MAKIFLDPNDKYTSAAGNADDSIFGGNGTETVVINAGNTGIVADANVERVELAGNVADFTFKQVGTTLEVYANGVKVADVGMSGTDTQLSFADGTANAKIVVGNNGPEVQIGGTAVPTGADPAAAVVPGTIDAGDTSTAAGGGNNGGGNPGGGTGQTFTLTDKIDNLTGTSGDDIFLGDNTSANAADTINGGAGTDTLRIFNSNAIGNLTSVENVEVNGNGGDIDLSSNADAKSLTIKDHTLAGGGTPEYTLSGSQTLTLNNVKDSDADNTDGVEIKSSASVTEQSIMLNKAGDTATGGFDLNIDVNGTGVATLNVDSSTNASKVSIENTGTKVRTLNISGDEMLTLANQSGANQIGSLVNAVNITNSKGVTLTSSVATNTTDGLKINGGTGKDTVTLAQAAAANALTNKVAVDLGAGDDRLAISQLNAAANIENGASFKGGEGVDTLNVINGALIDTTRGKLFSSFENVDVGGGTGTYDLQQLASTNTVGTLSVSGALAGAVTVNNLPDTASVAIAATNITNALTINEKDAGAGSPNDILDVSLSSKGAQNHAAAIDVNDIETVNLASMSTGTNVTHTLSQFDADEALTLNVNASTAGLTITNLEADALVLFDASASAKAVSVTTGADTFAATAGVAFKGGAGADTFVLTGANTSAAGAADLDFIITGGGKGDTVTLAAAGQVERVVFESQADSTATDYDMVSPFVTTEDKIDLTAFGFTGVSAGAVLTVAADSKASLDANNDVQVSAANAVNFFNDAGVDRAVAEQQIGADLFLFVDADKNGDYSASGDLVIQLSTLAQGGFDVGDVVFA